MFATSLHAFSRYGPNLSHKIDLIPLRAQHFTRSRSGKDKELEGLGTYAPFVVQRLHKGVNRLIRQRRLMLHFCYFAGLWKQLAKTTLQRCRIIACDKLTGFSPVHNSLNPLTDATGSFSLGGPNGFKHTQNLLHGDLVDGQFT